MGSATEIPVLLGVVTDIQYANKEDAYIDYVGFVRKYSEVLPKTERAVEHLNKNNVSMVIHLGDIIDGNNSLVATHDDLDRVMKAISALKAPVLHVLGNHCLAADRKHLLDRLGLSKRTYYSQDLSPKWRLIILDTVDVSVDQQQDHPNYKRALDYLKAHAGESNAQDWNGGLGPEQFEWLQDTLRDTESGGRFAIVCGHLPVLPEAAFPEHILWNNEVILDLFRQYRRSVKAYFGGHYHHGGYALKDGVHHITFESILDARDPDGSCAVVELSDSEIVVKGFGIMTSRTLPV